MDATLRESLKESLKKDFLRALELLGLYQKNVTPAQPLMPSNRERLYETAYAFLGTDVTPNDEVPDEVACAATVNAIHRKAFGQEIGGGASTANLYIALQNSMSFVGVSTPDFGDIIISPTGSSTIKGKIGHTGIVGKHWIMSNDSRTGTFEANYTLEGWARYFHDKNGFPVLFFRRL